MSDKNTVNIPEETATEAMVTINIPERMLVNLKHHEGTVPFNWDKVPEASRTAIAVYLMDFGLRQSPGDADAGMKGKSKAERKEAVRKKFDSFQSGKVPTGGGGGGSRQSPEEKGEIEWLKATLDSGAASKVNGKTLILLLKSRMRAEIVNAISDEDKRQETLGKVEELFPEWREKNRTNNKVLSGLIEVEKQREALKEAEESITAGSGMFG